MKDLLNGAPRGGYAMATLVRGRRFSLVLALMLALTFMPWATGPARAASADNSWNVPYGQLYVSAWECSTFLSSCSWKTKVQLRRNKGNVMDSLTNTTTVSAVGFKASVTISKTQSGVTITGNKTKIASVRWTKRVSNLVELSGSAKPSWTAIGITTKACLTGDGPKKNGAVSKKCAEIGLW